MNNILKQLSEPFPRESISWRAGGRSNNGKCQALAYIDARDVMDRLDNVVGFDKWQCTYPHAEGKTVCSIGIKIGDEWVWKSDGAGDSDVEAEKGALSDAFKRAAVRWGIGRYLYQDEYKGIWVECREENGKIKGLIGDPWKEVDRRLGKLNNQPDKQVKKPQAEDLTTQFVHKFAKEIESIQTYDALKAKLDEIHSGNGRLSAWFSKYSKEDTEHFGKREFLMQKIYEKQEELKQQGVM